jgi:hypothetical protein
MSSMNKVACGDAPADEMTWLAPIVARASATRPLGHVGSGAE